MSKTSVSRIPAPKTAASSITASKLTRRTFVHTSVAAAAAITAGPLVTRAQSPNEKLGVAVVGAGGRGGSHIGAWLGDKRTEILYIVDVDEAKGNARCSAIENQQGKRPILVKDMREAFDNDSVDVISTATPQPLARLVRHLGDASRQGRVYREACLP